MSHVFKLHVMPASIVSDRDPIFASQFWQELFKLCKVKLKMSTAYHPQTDGQTEVVNRCLENYLRCVCIDQPKTWLTKLPLAEWWYNTTYHTSLQTTPYEVVYGQPAPLHTPYFAGDSAIEAVDRTLKAREAAINQCKGRLIEAQQRMKLQADKHRTDKEFQVGDWVYLRLIPYRQSTLGQAKTTKLSPRYAGPFKISAKVGPVAYKLELPKGSRIHDTIQISCLKEKIGAEAVNPNLPGFLCDSTQEFEPEAILKSSVRKIDNRAVTVWLIKWKGKSAEDASWEIATEFQLRFPTFNP